LAVRFFHVGIMAGFLYLVPLMLQLSFEFTAMRTGLAMMPYSISLLVMAILGARLSSRFFANRIIQVGFIGAAAGLSMMAVSIQPEATPEDLALGALFGAGMGLVASQILNLILSAVTANQTPETAGLTSTFEQLGNAIFVALMGTVMLTVLNSGLADGIQASAEIPQEIQAPLIAATEEGVQLMSDTQMAQGLQQSGAGDAAIELVYEIYGDARMRAFRAGVSLLVYASLLALVIAIWLPKRKLVEAVT
jgi:hypothetical protein